MPTLIEFDIRNLLLYSFSLIFGLSVNSFFQDLFSQLHFKKGLTARIIYMIFVFAILMIIIIFWKVSPPQPVVQSQKERY